VKPVLDRGSEYGQSQVKELNLLVLFDLTWLLCCMSCGMLCTAMLSPLTNRIRQGCRE
jgi:hypothetical protein